jgi:acyl-CoA reductase-like NAD-dependent aldehyde dehydrogenase
LWSCRVARPYCDEAEAIAIANDTSYGLQSYVLSHDVDFACVGKRPSRCRGDGYTG